MFKNAKFITSATHPTGYPALDLDEVAVAGRSNVGKSSLLNHLFQTRKLVKTSSTPGKTQLLNFFTVDNSLAFADLPGYGFAKVPLSVRKKWGPMIQTYLETRERMKLVLFLFDIRRVPTEEDLHLLDWIVHADKAMILVLTKVDKVNQKEKRQYTDRILQAFGAENIHYIHYSVTKNIGRNQLIGMIQDALASEEES